MELVRMTKCMKHVLLVVVENKIVDVPLLASARTDSYHAISIILAPPYLYVLDLRVQTSESK